MKTGIRRVPKHPITSQKVVTFTFDGKKYTAYKGDTLASALTVSYTHLTLPTTPYV